jgi:hypothetical protein
MEHDDSVRSMAEQSFGELRAVLLGAQDECARFGLELGTVLLDTGARWLCVAADALDNLQGAMARDRDR